MNEIISNFKDIIFSITRDDIEAVTMLILSIVGIRLVSNLKYPPR